MNFAVDSAAKLNLNITTGNWFSGNNTNFGGNLHRKFLNININTGNWGSNNNTNFGGKH